VACVLAKASGKVVIIQEDELSEDGKTTRIECRIEDAEALLQSTTPEGPTQEQPIESLSPTPEIIVDKPMETIVTAQAAPNTTAPTLAEPIAASDTTEKSNSEPAKPTMVQRQEPQEISGSKSILNTLKRIQHHKIAPKSQEKQVSLDIQNLNKTIDEQEKKLYTELATVRQQIERLKQLTEETTPKQEQENKENPK
jgi:small-conductance mechanosensitive channel